MWPAPKPRILPRTVKPEAQWHGGVRAGRPLAMAAGVAVVLAVLAGCGVLPGSGEAQNVILIVGDGMGAAQRDAIQLAEAGAQGTLAMDALPVQGRVGTNSAGRVSPVTDSAAAATAMASGAKTSNGRVGIDAAGKAVPTVLERAAAAGKATGVVTTSSVTDATPAAFAAQVEDRGLHREIARQYLQGGELDVILGGGRRFWEAAEGRPDDLTERARERGYAYVDGRAGLENRGAGGGSRLLGLFAEEAMYEADSESGGGSYAPAVPLPEMTRKAISVLSQDRQGFFLLVEEEAIDAMGHARNAGAMLRAGEALDRSVGVAKDFAEEEGDTLLIVVGDHETCGLSVEAPAEGGGAEGGDDGPFEVAGSPDQEFVLDCSTSDHTAVDVPLAAMGPGAERLEGAYENTRIYGAMMGAMGLDTVD